MNKVILETMKAFGSYIDEIDFLEYELVMPELELRRMASG